MLFIPAGALERKMPVMAALNRRDALCLATACLEMFFLPVITVTVNPGVGKDSLAASALTENALQWALIVDGLEKKR